MDTSPEESPPIYCPPILPADQPQTSAWSFPRLKQRVSQRNLFVGSADSSTDSVNLPDDTGLQSPHESRQLEGKTSRRDSSRFRLFRSRSSRNAERMAEEDKRPVSRIVVNLSPACAPGSPATKAVAQRQSEPGEAQTLDTPRLSRTASLFDLLPNWVLRSCEVIARFFDQSFPDKARETAFQTEQDHAHCHSTLAVGILYVLVWISHYLLAPSQNEVHNLGFLLGLQGICMISTISVRMLHIAFCVGPFWQKICVAATWAPANLAVLEGRSPGFRTASAAAWNNPPNLVVFAPSILSSTIAALALGQTRLATLLGFLQYAALSCTLFSPSTTRLQLYGGMIYLLLLHILLLAISSIIERASRRSFETREQLKLQYKATRYAKRMERKASDLTKRFVSYIFHEVRVPLNTATLSLQNLEGEKAFKEFNGGQLDLIYGLTSSLAMMEQVLNDVLSFNHMESGIFDRSEAPFDLHRSMNLTVLAHAASAHTKGLALQTHLDPKIDGLDCFFVGDEKRLRQITSNLVSNAIKFTQSGSVTLTTKLLCANISNLPLPTLSGHDDRRRPSLDVFSSSEETLTNESPSNDAPQGVSPVLSTFGRLKPGSAVVRVEVGDTGEGLRASDMEGDRLFAPYVQTELGRKGGKGTGLGLAFVRQIVELSKGRLGVDSQHGKGTTVWFELPYALGCNTSTPCADPTPTQSAEEKEKEGEDDFLLMPADWDFEGGEVTIPSTEAFNAYRVVSATTLEPIDLHASPQIDPIQAKTDVPPRMDLDQAGKDSTSLGSDSSTAVVRPIGSYSLSREASPVVSNAMKEALDVLVVDDDKLTRQLMARMLTRLGHKVNTAENGQAALDKIIGALHKVQGAKPVDIVFLDNQMPLMTGIEATTHVRALKSTLFIVGCTGNALRADQEEYLSAGADIILTKPIKQAAMERCIQEARKRLSGDSTAGNLDGPT